ncbi:MAG: universal stress protein [Rubripirellula sp.]
MERFKNILVYTGTDDFQQAINRAVEIAIDNQASLTLMDVVKPLPHAFGMLADLSNSNELENLEASDRRAKLLDIASEYSDTGVPLDVVVSVGDPATEIVRQVLADEHDLVVKTADGLSIAGRLFGSVARSLLRSCPCPVWLLKPEVHGEFDCVIAAIDADSADESHLALNRQILELAYSISQRDNAQLHVVSAWQLWMEDSLRRRAGDGEVDDMLARHEAKVRSALDELLQSPIADSDSIHVHVRRGTPASVVRSVAEEIEADLMVMGTLCRTGVAGFLIGNTAESIISELTCSLLAVKPDGFVSPVAEAEPARTNRRQELPLL